MSDQGNIDNVFAQRRIDSSLRAQTEARVDAARSAIRAVAPGFDRAMLSETAIRKIRAFLDLHVNQLVSDLTVALRTGADMAPNSFSFDMPDPVEEDLKPVQQAPAPPAPRRRKQSV